LTTPPVKEAVGGNKNGGDEGGVAIQIPAKKISKGYIKRLRTGWNLYKESTVGKIGLGIMIGFVFLAIFAPIIAPYPPGFIAPSEDVFRADFVKVELPAAPTIGLDDPLSEHWHAPVGYSGNMENLDTIMVYSSEGHLVRYKVSKTTKVVEGSDVVGMDLTDPETHTFPANATYVRPLYFRSHRYFVVAEKMITEISYNTLAPIQVTELSFHPTYFSNMWNRWSSTNTAGIMLFGMANDTAIALMAKIPPNQLLGEYTERTVVSIKNLGDMNETAGQHVVGAPLVMDRPNMENGSLMIVPLNESLVAFRIEKTGDNPPTSVRLGDLVWQTVYSEVNAGPDREPGPIPDRPISFYKNDPAEDIGKEIVVFASTDGYLYSFYTRNGSLAWSTSIAGNRIREPSFEAVYATYRGEVLAIGSSEGRGFIARIDPSTGLIAQNGTALYTMDGTINSVPEYIASSRLYIFSTDRGVVYILKETMELFATFTVSGGVSTPVSYVGNIINNVGSYQGNYFALITKDGSLYSQSITGFYAAPLKPGVYASGNRYLLGTDVFGHDIFSQLVYATRIELIVGIVAALIAVGVGTGIGLISGYYGGWVDTILMRITDIFLTLPVLVIILLMAAILGGSIINIIIIIALFSWSGIARVIRAQTLSLKTRSFIDAARISGATDSKIILRHLAPNVLPFTFLYMTFTTSGAIITEAILAFLGFGDPRIVTWGMMLQYLRISGNTLTAPWWLLPPGVAITLLSLSFYLIGRAFDEVVNPRLRSR